MRRTRRHSQSPSLLQSNARSSRSPSKICRRRLITLSMRLHLAFITHYTASLYVAQYALYSNAGLQQKFCLTYVGHFDAKYAAHMQNMHHICEFSHMCYNFCLYNFENAIICAKITDVWIFAIICGKICDMWMFAKYAIACICDHTFHI